MLINEVELEVGLSKKSIRYYEQVGLFKPQRRKDNSYREYTKEDITTLKKIKFLRELDIPINDLKKLNTKELTLKECLQEKIQKIENYEQNYKKLTDICKDIIENNLEYENLDIDTYLKKIIQLKKEGFTLNHINYNQTKRIQGAIISSVVFIFIFVFFISIITYFQITEIDKMPTALYIFFMGIFFVLIISIVFNLIDRIKEIKGGEEDEASKY